MAQGSKFQMVIEPPGAGWVRIEIKCDELRQSFLPSYLSDAIGDMVRAAASLAERKCGWGGESCFDWQDEPGAWRWHLVPADGELRVLVTQHAKTFPDQGAKGATVLELVVPGRRFCNAVLRAMDTIAQQMTLEQFEEGWRLAYPGKDVERLRAAIQSWK